MGGQISILGDVLGRRGYASECGVAEGVRQDGK